MLFWNLFTNFTSLPLSLPLHIALPHAFKKMAGYYTLRIIIIDSITSEQTHITYLVLFSCYYRNATKMLLNVHLCMHIKVYLQDKFLELDSQGQRLWTFKCLYILTIALQKYHTNLYFHQQYIKVNCIFKQCIQQVSYTRTYAINKINPCGSFEQLIE